VSRILAAMESAAAETDPARDAAVAMWNAAQRGRGGMLRGGPVPEANGMVRKATRACLLFSFVSFFLFFFFSCCGSCQKKK
jgi:hypothetical protein